MNDDVRAMVAEIKSNEYNRAVNKLKQDVDKSLSSAKHNVMTLIDEEPNMKAIIKYSFEANK